MTILLNANDEARMTNDESNRKSKNPKLRAQHPTSNAQRPTPHAPRPMPNVQRTSPLTTVSAPECRQTARTRETVQCGRCCKVFSGAAVVNGAIEPDFLRHGYFLLRTLYCDHCHHLQVWRQICTIDGILTPDLIDQDPGFIKDAKRIDAFLTDHPESAGIEDLGSPRDPHTFNHQSRRAGKATKDHE